MWRLLCERLSRRLQKRPRTARPWPAVRWPARAFSAGAHGKGRRGAPTRRKTPAACARLCAPLTPLLYSCVSFIAPACVRRSRRYCTVPYLSSHPPVCTAHAATVQFRIFHRACLCAPLTPPVVRLCRVGTGACVSGRPTVERSRRLCRVGTGAARACVCDTQALCLGPTCAVRRPSDWGRVCYTQALCLGFGCGGPTVERSRRLSARP